MNKRIPTRNFWKRSSHLCFLPPPPTSLSLPLSLPPHLFSYSLSLSAPYAYCHSFFFCLPYLITLSFCFNCSTGSPSWLPSSYLPPSNYAACSPGYLLASLHSQQQQLSQTVAWQLFPPSTVVVTLPLGCSAASHTHQPQQWQLPRPPSASPLHTYTNGSSNLLTCLQLFHLSTGKKYIVLF